MNIQQIEIPAITFIADESFFEKLKRDHNLRFCGNEEVVTALKNIDQSLCNFEKGEAYIMDELDSSNESVSSLLQKENTPPTEFITLSEFLRNIFYFLNQKKELLVNDGYNHTHMGLVIFNRKVFDTTLLYHADIGEWIATIFSSSPNFLMIKKIIAMSDPEV